MQKHNAMLTPLVDVLTDLLKMIFDPLVGMVGDDVYLFNRGNGQDAILDASGTDVIRFGEGIAEIRWRNHAFIIEGNKAANDDAANEWRVTA